MQNVIDWSTVIPIEVWQDEPEPVNFPTPITDSIFFSYFPALNPLQVAETGSGTTAPLQAVHLTPEELATLANIQMTPPAPSDLLVSLVRKRLAQD